MMLDLDKLLAVAGAAGGKEWIRLFGERTVYDRMEDGCRGIAIVRSDCSPPIPADAANLDFIAAFNPAVAIELIQRFKRAEAALAPMPNDSLNDILPLPVTGSLARRLAAGSASIITLAQDQLPDSEGGHCD